MYAQLRSQEQTSPVLPLRVVESYTAVGIIYDAIEGKVLSDDSNNLSLPQVTLEGRIPSEADLSTYIGQQSNVYLTAARFQEQPGSPTPNTKYFLAPVTTMERELYGGNWVAADLEELLQETQGE